VKAKKKHFIKIIIFLFIISFSIDNKINTQIFVKTLLISKILLILIPIHKDPKVIVAWVLEKLQGFCLTFFSFVRVFYVFLREIFPIIQVITYERLFSLVIFFFSEGRKPFLGLLYSFLLETVITKIDSTTSVISSDRLTQFGEPFR
jgi:hypothetical protein